MKVFINFITKNKEIFILILLLLSVIILFKYNLKEGHITRMSDSESDLCDEEDNTNDILLKMIEYLDTTSKMWTKLIEVNDYYQTFKDDLMQYQDQASHETTCGNNKSSLPINMAEKYMRESEQLLIGKDGVYELFKKHTILFDALKQEKLKGYDTEIIPDSRPSPSEEANNKAKGYWNELEDTTILGKGSEGIYLTFTQNDKIGNNGSINNEYETYVYQACSVCEETVGEIWANCAEAICIQKQDTCDLEINNKTNKLTYNKTKICTQANYKCPGGANAYLTYLQFPSDRKLSTIYVDPTLSSPTQECPKAFTKDALRDCYYGKINDDNFINKYFELDGVGGENDINWTKTKKLLEEAAADKANALTGVEQAKINQQKAIDQAEADKLAYEKRRDEINQQNILNAAEIQANAIRDAQVAEAEALQAEENKNQCEGVNVSVNLGKEARTRAEQTDDKELYDDAQSLCIEKGNEMGIIGGCGFSILKPNGENSITQNKSNGKFKNWTVDCGEPGVTYN